MAVYRSLTMALAFAVGLLVSAQPGQAQLFGGGRENTQATVRLNQMEEQMRALTGQVEELSHQLRVLQDQLRRMQEDNEYRFQQLEGSGTRKRSDVAPEGTLSRPTGTLANDGSGGYGPAADTLGQLPEDPAGLPGTGNGPLDLSALARGLSEPNDGGDTTADALPGVPRADDPVGNSVANLDVGSDPRSAYDTAYQYLLAGDYESAEAGFRQFLLDHPNDRLAGSAQFWLGETHYARGNYREAADAFLKSYTDYPDGSKVTDSLLKLGLSLKGLGQRDAACATFSELLTKYPSAPAPVRAEAQSEQRRVGCS